MEEIDHVVLSRQRFNTLLMTVFGISGLLLSAVGIYGLMAFSVEQRTQELGIRMALGAPRSQLRNMVLSQGMMLTLFGVLIGLGAALWLSRFLASFLFGVKAWTHSLSSLPSVAQRSRVGCDVDSGHTRHQGRPDDSTASRID